MKVDKTLLLWVQPAVKGAVLSLLMGMWGEAHGWSFTREMVYMVLFCVAWNILEVKEK